MKFISALILIGAIGLGAGAATPLAAAPEGPAQAQARFRPRVADRQVQAMLTRIRTSAESLLRTIDGVPASGRVWGNPARQAGDVSFLIEDLLRATSHLSDHITRQLTIRADVDDVLRRGVAVDQALGRTTQTRAVQTSWNNIRLDLERLASAYNLTWDWRNPQYSDEAAPGLYRQLTGTYTLDVARSDNPQRTIDAALRSVPAADRARVSRQLINRLDAPESIAIDRSEGRIVIASSRGPQFTFEADGQPRTETGGAGQTITTRASVYGDQLDVRTVGVANNEFGVTFEPLSGGQSLQVTREVYNDALRQPVSLRTVYRKTSDTPDWSLYDRAASANAPARPGRWNAGVIVPAGTVLVARLDQAVNLRTAREDDRITLTVRNSPNPEFEGATIEGTILNTGARTGDRGRVSVQFDQIRLRNGRYGEFDGVIEKITGPNGQTISFDGEQAAVDRDRTSGDALQRGAIGAAIGGLIGALAGGGKGALIGAAIGGGGAAATVLLDDNDLTLQRNTEFQIRARTR
jgi:hypothetical protein